MAKYSVMKQRKSDRKVIGFLSPKKRRWLSKDRAAVKNYRIGKFNEQEADEFINARQGDSEYYYLKTVAQ